MKRTMCGLFAILLLSSLVFADLKSDILGITDNNRTKFVWRRFTWANDNFSPKSRVPDPYASTSLVLFDTEEGSERILDSDLAAHNWIRITRSGKWVIWNEKSEERSYIANLSGEPNKRILIDKSAHSAWFVGAVGVDIETKQEYLYCLDGFNENIHGTTIVRIPLSSDGSAGINNSENIPESDNGNFDNTYSVSADGKKIGCAHPWPDTYILDTESGDFAGRHGNAMFGCHACLAPDNSYRFYHFNDEHDHLWMFGPAMSTNSTSVALNNGSLPYNTWPAGEESPSHMGPRWSNHVRFFAGSYPLEIQNALSEDGQSDFGDIYALSASQVQNDLRMDILGIAYLGKFSSDFTSVETYVTIAADKRQFNWHGDAWMASGITDGSDPTAVLPAMSPQDRMAPASAIDARVVDVRGRALSFGETQRMARAAQPSCSAVYIIQKAGSGQLRRIVE